MKYLYPLLSLLFIFPLFSSAQNNYKPGYVVTLKGDTVKGFINYKEWNSYPKSIDFKQLTSEKKAQIYTPYTINTFAIGDVVYKRYTGPISQDAIALNRLSHEIDTTYKTDTVFFKRYVHGKSVSLYEYIDQIKARYFVSENDSQPYELLNHIYLGNDNFEVRDNQYRQQLQKLRLTYIPNDVGLIANIQRTPSTVNELAKIIQKLNGQTAAKVYASRAGFKFFAGAGVSNGTVRVQNVFDFKDTKTPNYTSAMINVGVDYLLNKNLPIIVLRGELSYYANKVDLFFSNVGVAPGPHETTVSMDQKVVSFMPQVIYNFNPTDAANIYLGMGAALNSSIYSNKKAYYTYPAPYYITTVNSMDAFPIVKTFYVNIVPKIGVIVKRKIDVHIAYFPSVQISNDPVGILSITAYRAGLSYIF